MSKTQNYIQIKTLLNKESVKKCLLTSTTGIIKTKSALILTAHRW